MINPDWIDWDGFQRKLDAGRGSGSGEIYDPWLHTGEVPSRGRQHRVKGWRHGRPHHLMSNYELWCFYSFEWDKSVVEIREQFPLLPIQKTLALAEEMQIEHPAIRQLKRYNVLTSDFRLTLQRTQRVDIICTFKEAQELTKPRVQEKLRIEQCFWEAQGLAWSILTEADIPMVRAKNVERIHNRYHATRVQQDLQLSTTKFRAIVKLLTKEVQRGDAALNELGLASDERLGLDPGTSLAVAYHCIAARLWPINMDILIDPNKPLSFL
jgi:hypothetical protein